MEPNISNEISSQNTSLTQQESFVEKNSKKRASLPLVLTILAVILIGGMVSVVLFYKPKKPQMLQNVAIIPPTATMQNNTITPSVYLMPSDFPTEGPFPQTYEAIFTSLQLPGSFKLIATIPGHEGTGGTLSLEKKYAVQGTRETILKQLEPLLDKIGYNITENATQLDTTHNGYRYDFYTAVNKNLASIDVWLKPNYPDQPANYNKSTMTVTEVDMLLSGL